MPANPTELTLRQCKRNGWRAQKVEHYNAHTKRLNDLFGFGDVLALDDGKGALLIQCTTDHHARSRVQKIFTKCRDACVDWLDHGNRAEVWGWYKAPRPGSERHVWQFKRYPIGVKDSGEEEAT